MKKLGYGDPIEFPVVPILIFDTTKAKALYLYFASVIYKWDNIYFAFLHL